MLTQLQITNAKPCEKPYKLSDGNGLALLIQPQGGRLWRFRYHFDGREKMLSLGGFPDVTLAQARERRDAARRLLADGIDPARQREEDKRAQASVNANTFGVLSDEYIQRLADQGAAESTLSKNRWLLKDLAAPLTKRPMVEITPAEIYQLLQRVSERDQSRDDRAGARTEHKIEAVAKPRAAEHPFNAFQHAKRVEAFGTPTVEAQDAAGLICRELRHPNPTICRIGGL
jgi:hypothetical protein